MKKRVYDVGFKKMAVELSDAKGSVKAAADELGFDPGRIRKWKNHYKSGDGSVSSSNNLSDVQKEIRRLQKKLRGDTAGTLHLKKGVQYRFEGRRQVFRFIKAHKTEYTVEKMCRVLQVSSCSYYYWLKHPVSKNDLKSQELLLQIKQIYQQSRCCYGSPRITIKLKQAGIMVSRHRVARVMKRANLQSIVRQKYRIQTIDFKHRYTESENYLGQDFTTERLAQKWVSDLIYIKTWEGWLLPDYCYGLGRP